MSIFLLLFLFNVNSQNLTLPSGFPSFNISNNNSPDDGYLFLNIKIVNKKRPSSLVITDNYGTPVFYQHQPLASGAFALLDNGLLAFRTKLTATSVAMFYVMDSSYNIIDSVGMSDFKLDSHDILGLENGHYIIFGIDSRITDLSEYGGIVDATVSGCVIQELDENKTVVFEWNSWDHDHFEITDTYNDLTVSAIDMVHPNSLELDYDGNILLISRSMNEVTKINRVTGDIIWRLGGKNNQFTFSDPAQMFSMPHDINVLDNGNYTLFDNGNEKDPTYTRAVEYAIDEENMTIEMIWEYDANKEIFSATGGSARRLPSGTTILGYGGAASRPAVIEVHPDGSKAWQLDFIDNKSSGRAVKNQWRTNLFKPNTYSVNFGAWDEYTSSEYLLTITNNSNENLALTGYSTRTDAFTITNNFPVEIPAMGNTVLTVSYFPNNIDYGVITDVMTIDSDIDSDTLTRRVSQQIKLSGTKLDSKAPEASILLDNMEGVSLNTNIQIVFTEPIRKMNEDPFTYINVDEIVSVNEGSADGTLILFDAVINTDKNIIGIVPNEPLAHTQIYFVTVSDTYSDFSGNQGSSASGSFKTIDLTSPIATINPTDGSVEVNPDDPILITFNEPVRNSNDALLTQSSLSTLVILKSESSAGVDVEFSATINEDNTVINISPLVKFSANSIYYVSLLEEIEDFNDNLSNAIASQFTTGFYTGINSAEQMKVNLYPNPGTGIFMVKFYEADDYKLKLYDITGKIAYQDNLVKNTDYKLNISSLPNGIYFLKLIGIHSGKVFDIRLIKE